MSLLSKLHCCNKMIHNHSSYTPLTSTWPHLRCDVGLEEGEYEEKLSLSCSIVYCYNGAQRYEQFLQVGQLYRALILLSLVLCRAPLYLRSSWCYFAYILLYLLVSWAWRDWPLTWLTNHHPSVLRHCWLGHLTRKTVSEMTYVSSGTLNTTIPYHTSYVRG